MLSSIKAKRVNKMSRSVLWMSMLILTLLFSACAQDDQVENPPNSDEGDQTNSQTENESPSNQNDDETSPYIFVEFDLDADFDGIDDTVEAEFEFDKNDIEASYENKVEDTHLLGDEALDYLDPIFSSFTFDENTSEREVLDIVIEAFNLPNDAVIDLEIEFKNGEERQYMQM